MSSKMNIRSICVNLTYYQAEQITYGVQMWGISLQFAFLNEVLFGKFEVAFVPCVFQDFIQKQNIISKVHMNGFYPSCMWVGVELFQDSATRNTLVRQQLHKYKRI